MKNNDLPLQSIQQHIDALSLSTGLPIRFVSTDREVTHFSLKEHHLCTPLSLYKSPESSCGQCFHTAQRVAKKMGEAYIFTCPSGFIHIAMSLLQDLHDFGTILIGPIQIKSLESHTLEEFIRLHQESANQLAESLVRIQRMRSFTSHEIHALATLTYITVTRLFDQEIIYKKLREEKKSQARIGETLYDYKTSNSPLQFSNNNKTDVLEFVLQCQKENAKASMKKLINDLLLLESGNLDLVKVRVLEFYSLIARTAVEKGLELNSVFDLNFKFVSSLSNIFTVNELHAWAAETISFFVDELFVYASPQHTPLISKTLSILEENFMTELSLRSVAKELHVSEGHLSKLFHREMDIPFSNYINQLRIAKSKELLQNTNMTISEIAFAVGYNHQNYFTRVFKRLSNMSPSVFRAKK